MRYHEVLPLMRLCEHEDTRKKLDKAWNMRCPSNSSTLQNLLNLRHQLAQKLNFESYAAYILSDRMASEPIILQTFMEDMVNGLLEKGKEDIEQLAIHKRETTGDPNASINGWDKSFYNNLMKNKDYVDLDEEKIKEYFPTKHVIPECMAIFGEMLEVEFKLLKEEQASNGYGKWHEEVEVYSVQCKREKGKELGHIYLDLYPRDHKYPYAAAFPLLRRAVVNG